MSQVVSIFGALLFLLGCYRIQARYQESWRRMGNKILREEPDYVTHAEFDESIGALQAGLSAVQAIVDDMGKKMANMDSDLTDVQEKINTDHCQDSPCQNGGTCNNNIDGYTCSCTSSFGGSNCDLKTGLAVVKVLQTDNGGLEGDWGGDMSMCPPGSYARSFRIKLEPDQGTGDDSAMNAISLMCHSPTAQDDKGEIRNLEGPFGSWQTWQDCPSGHYLSGLQMKVEPDQGGHPDDSAVNGVTMTCTDGTKITGPIGVEGTFGSTDVCPDDSAICGVRTRVEDNQGGNDDSALNDIHMACCAF